jgi:hypothetical protein
MQHVLLIIAGTVVGVGLLACLVLSLDDWRRK